MLCTVAQDEITAALERFDEALEAKNRMLAWRMAIKLSVVAQRRRSEIRRNGGESEAHIVEGLDRIDQSLRQVAKHRSADWEALQEASRVVHEVQDNWQID